MSVPEAVRQVLASNNVYLQALELGIANYTALAEKIKPEIEELLGSQVNLNTVVVAIKRHADAARKQGRSSHPSRPSAAAASAAAAAAATKPKMSLTSSIIDIDFQQQYDSALAEILEDFFELEEGRYGLFQTDNHFNLLADDSEENRSLITGGLKKINARIKEGLSKITIVMSPDEQNPYSLLSLISSILYNHRIPVHSAFFTLREIVLVLEDKDAARAYDLIRMKIG
ncbi:hypothetical protein [Nitrososphaera sp.]|uniref:hypothetical protein n=1 Tax=Nitrososphaera sp. TaxID=1971748 RepID=UPI00307DFB5F